MKILLDTNIILDVLARREPFFSQSQSVMQLVAQGAVQGAVTASSITDIYYILRKHLGSDSSKAALRGLMELLEVIAVDADACFQALELPMNDYEDSLLACCAKRWSAEYIITRNTKDFEQSPIQACTPGSFLNEWSTR